MSVLRITRFPMLDHISTEGFNTLITSISYSGSNVRKMMITSRYVGEGKSYVTMNLMRTLAGMGRKVVVVDTDLRASGIQADYMLRFSNANRFGLSDYLSGYCPLDDALYRTNIANAWIIPAGQRVSNPLQLLDSENMKQLMDGLATEFDVVLVDTPPAGVLVDAVALAKFCDGALLVVGYRHGKRREIGDTVECIRQTGCRVLGAVLNEVRFRNLSNRHYYYSSKRYSDYYEERRGSSRRARLET